MNISGNQFVFPNRVDDPAMQANLDALARWINSQVTNQVVAGSNVTVEAQPVQGGPNKSNGIVTISSTSSSGGYDSLTGAGETATPGKLTQAGGFTVDDPDGDGILFETAKTGSSALELSTTNINSEIFLNAGGGGASGVNIYTNGTDGITLQDAQTHAFLETNNSGNMTLGGGSFGGYVEISAGGFIVTGTGSPVSILCEGENLIINNSCAGASQLLIESTGNAHLIIQTAAAELDISATGGSLNLTGDTNGIFIAGLDGNVSIQTSSAGNVYFSYLGGVGGGEFGVAYPKMGFFGATPVAQPAAGSTAGVYAAGVALGLWT